jgi:integrating conjugative element protein (TIGR03758 family)
MSADQVNAFTSNSGFAPAACAVLLESGVFALLMLWGVWAIRTAYVGWAEDRIPNRVFLGVLVRFVALVLVLSFLLLS